MRWITFLLLVFLMAALEMAHFADFPRGPNDSWPGIEYMVLLAVFYALFAAETAAPLAALVCGAMYDVLEPTFIGTNMIPLALVAWLCVRVRLSIFREHAISQVIMTLLAVLAFGVLSVIWRKVLGAPLYGHSMLAHLGRLAGDAVYSAMVAPLVFSVFFRFRGLLGFSPLRARGR
jgi:rod shape-determining protein MreD